MENQVCDCINCDLPPCVMCNEDHGGLEFSKGDETVRLCRDCWMDAMMNRIWLHEQANPGSLDARLRELANMLNAKARAHMGRA